MTLDEFSLQFGVERQTLHVWISRRWLIAENETMREIDVARARLIRDMQTDLGVNDEGVDVALHLLDQVHELRRMMADLRRRTGRE